MIPRWSHAVRSTPANNPERQAFAREIEMMLENGDRRLPDGLREVFMLRQVEGMSTAETADVPRHQRGSRQDAPVARARGVARDLIDAMGDARRRRALRFLRPRCDRVVAAVLARIA